MTWPRLLEELLRRARPPAATRLAQRWTAWARWLAEGRARADAAGGGPPMTLLAPGGAGRAPDRGSWVGHRLQLAVRVLHAHEPRAAAAPGRGSAAARAADGATGPPRRSHPPRGRSRLSFAPRRLRPAETSLPSQGGRPPWPWRRASAP